MLRTVVMAVPLMLLASPSAVAGEHVIIEHAPPTAPFKDKVRVSVNMSLFVPAAIDDSEASMKAQEHARRMLYESAGNECNLLRTAIANECRLEGISINMRVSNSYGQRAQGLNASGNFSYRITLK